MESPNAALRPSADEVATFTAYLIARYEDDKERRISRFRLSRDSLRRMAQRTVLRDAFIEDWREALASIHGWLAFPRGEEFGLLRDDAIDGWVRIGTKRVQSERSRMRQGDRRIFDDMWKQLSEREAEHNASE